MSEQVNKKQTKGAEQENITEFSDEQLAEAQGGAATRIQSDDLRDGNDYATHKGGAAQVVKSDGEVIVGDSFFDVF